MTTLAKNSTYDLKHPETKKALLLNWNISSPYSTTRIRKSFESSEAVSYALASHGMEKSHAASQSTEDIPVLSAVVDDMDDEGYASFRGAHFYLIA